MIEPELQALLQACKDEPDDDAPRLVLSDWLEEHGQADRAEFVRLQVRLARQEVPAGDEAVAAARAHELYLRHADEWLGGLRGWAGGCTFRRGLIQATARVEDLRDRPPAAVAPQAVPWLEGLVLKYGRQSAAVYLLEEGALAPFTSLDLTGVQLTPPWLERLARSPRMAHLRGLRVAIRGPSKAAGEALARSPHLSGLRVLDVPEGMGDACLESLVASPILQSLSTLAFRFPSVRRGAAALAQCVPAPRIVRLRWEYVRPGAALRDLLLSPVLAEVVELQLEQAEISAAGARAFAERGAWPRLQRLSLAGNPLKEGGAQALAGDLGFPALRHVHLGATGLDARSLRTLLSAPWASGLEHLDLRANKLGDGGAEAVASTAALANLRSLDLVRAEIGPKGARALANSPHLARLESLDLSDNSLGEDGVAALAGATGLPSLTALSLDATGLNAEGLARLARSPLPGRLRRLDLSRNRLDRGALQALVSSELAGLKELRLNWNSVGEEGAQALARAPFRGLVRLELAHTRLGDAGVDALLETHGFPCLAILNLYGAGHGRGAEAALLRWPRLSHLARFSSHGYSGSSPELRAMLRPSATWSDRS
jgi:uncharacterized protein (TIGR02996 family)